MLLSHKLGMRANRDHDRDLIFSISYPPNFKVALPARRQCGARWRGAVLRPFGHHFGAYRATICMSSHRDCCAAGAIAKSMNDTIGPCNLATLCEVCTSLRIDPLRLHRS
jgi:hypothetical protein